MSTETIGISARLQQYIRSVSVPADKIWEPLFQDTLQVAGFNIQIAPEQGQFLAVLVKLLNVTRAIEIGTFTGYSALCLARAMPDDAHLITCDIDEQWANVGKPYWRKAGVYEKIELKLGPASETLDSLLENHHANAFDLAFIDADKQNYVAYYEQCLKLVRQGGVIAIDNTLWSGRVAKADTDDPDTMAIRDLNQHIHNDDRVDACLLTIGDGLTLAYKR